MNSLLLINCLPLLLLVSNLTPLVQSECNVCNAHTNTACISPTELQQCENNKPFGYVYKCNPGYYCSILGDCTKSIELSDCQMCNKCEENKKFTCTGTQKFAVCVNGSLSDWSAECPENYYCNINDANVCGNNTPTCPFSEDPTPAPTAPSPAKDPHGFCQYVQKKGRYPVGTNPQTTCRQFIVCTQLGGIWYGPVYNCPGESYFDVTTNVCVAERPSICSGTVRHLTYRNILLE